MASIIRSRRLSFPGTLFRRLIGDQRGNTVIEFAIVTPVMLIMVMGASEVAYQAYVQSILEGAVQKAARDSAIQGGAQNAPALDQKVVKALALVMRTPLQNCGAVSANTPTWCSARKSYRSFSDIKPEPFTDLNKNGIRDAKECFEDINGNGLWDADPGLIGQGGADDVTIYSMTINYPLLFPMWGLAGWNKMQTVSSKTILKNQPYASRTIVAPETVCT